MELTGYCWVASAGETFDQIAYYVYGAEKFASDLIYCNPALADKLVFTGGEKIELPKIIVNAVYNDGLAAFKAPWK